MKTFIACCEAFEAAPTSLVFTIAGALCAVLALADLTERYRSRWRR